MSVGGVPPAALAATSTPGKALELGGKVVHPGCISELAQAIDGDSIVRSVFLLIPGARACGESNRYFQKPYWQRDLLWYDENAEGDRFGYQLYRTLDPHTYVLKTSMETSGTYHATSWLLVRVDEGTDWGVEQGKPIQRQVTALTRLGEVSSVEAAEALIRSRQKAGPREPPPP